MERPNSLKPWKYRSAIWLQQRKVVTVLRQTKEPTYTEAMTMTQFVERPPEVYLEDIFAICIDFK